MVNKEIGTVTLFVIIYREIREIDKEIKQGTATPVAGG